MKQINDLSNKARIAIVSVGYNRLKSQVRQLSALARADYSGFDNVPLIISIDCSGDTELYDYVRNYEWPHGDKYVIIRETRMGLKDHILACGDLTQYFKGIILLEDDIYVSKDYYNYINQMEKAYGNDDNICSIALYSNEMNGYCWLPLVRLKNESDVFADQAVSTWGEYWNERMWKGFREWLAKTDIPWADIDMPHQIKEWTKAWSKFFDAYMVLEGRWSIFPYTSLTTNFSDAGEHGDANNTIVQVSLQQGHKTYQTLPFEKLVKYDIYSNNIGLADALNIPLDDICLDLYGVRPNDHNRRYYLTVKKLPYKVVESYGLYMRPHELNVIERIPGNDIFLYDTVLSDKAPNGGSFTNRMLYYQHGFNWKFSINVCWGNYVHIFKKVISRLGKQLFK
ncbi:hypothetical protein MR642_02270 [bacterium]|nr:hypothetical protein [bacterium]